MKVMDLLTLGLLLLLSLTSAQANSPILVSDADEPRPAGVAISFSQLFWSNFIKGLLPEIFKKLGETVFEGGSARVDLKNLTSILVTVDSFEITQITYDLERTKVVLNDTDNSMGIYIANSTFTAVLQYELDFDPNFLSDVGNLTFGFINFNLDLAFRIGDGKDPANIDVKILSNALNFTSRDLFIRLNNTNDFNQMMIFLVNTIQTPVMNIIFRVLEEYLETGINAAIHAVPNPISLGDISLDGGLIEAANITSTHTANRLVGKFFPTGQELPFTNNNTLPDWDPNGQSLQVFISEFTLQSYMYSAFVLGKLNTTIENSPSEFLLPFNTDSFSYFIPALLKKYGSGKKTRLTLAAALDYPRLAILTDNVKVTGKIHMGVEVLLADGTWETALIAEVNGIFDVNLKITGDLILHVSINEVELYVTKVIEQKVDSVNIDMLRKLTGIVEEALKLFINTFLFSGISLKKLLPIPINLGTVAFKMQKGYLTLQATPVFPMTELYSKIADFIQEYIIDSPSKFLTLNGGDRNSSIGQMFRKELVKEMRRTNFKELFGRHKLSGVKSAYKSYKFFESVFNLPNPDFVQEDFSDL